MAKNDIINVIFSGVEVGKLGFDEDENKSFFQYNPAFLGMERYKNLFPETGIIKPILQTQVFTKYNSETFRGLPPPFADSLPDLFGNIIFKEWLEASNKGLSQITIIEQLAYVANRGMGALEYRPSKTLPRGTTIDIEEIVGILKKVLSKKENTQEDDLSSQALLNVFKIGSSAGGARPKILVSEHKKTGKIHPGDIHFSSEYNHYLIKLSMDEELGYNREAIEYAYYKTATQLGINMMSSKLIDEKHFATLRFDRQNGIKKHVLTATGMTGWDFKDPEVSSYENLFELAHFLKIPLKEINELYRRMIFNVIYCNTDDHLKNHSFIYNEKEDNWNLSPAYDLTYSLNPLINYKRTSRALSINSKRVDVSLDDVLQLADLYTIKNPKGIVAEVQDAIEGWETVAEQTGIPDHIVESIKKDFNLLLDSPPK